MAKYGDYSQFYDTVNRDPKRFPVDSSTAAAVALPILGVVTTGSQAFDDGVEFLNGEKIVGIFATSRNLLFHRRGIALV